MKPSTDVVAPAPTSSRRPSLTTQIFIGLAIGIAIGHFFPAFGAGIKPLADAFLKMIKMIIAPLLFSTLVVGIAGTGDLKSMGRIGAKAIIWFELATTFALVVGLAMVNFFKPGAGLAVPIGANTDELAKLATAQQSAWDIFLHIFPTSVFDAMAKGDILQMVVFATFFGIALAAVGEKGKPVLEFFDSVAQVMFKFTGYVMTFAPIGVFAAIAATVGSKGLGILVTLGKLVIVMYAGLAIFVFVVIVGAALLIRVPVLGFMRTHPRAVPDRVHDRQQRGGPAQVARGHGALRRAQEHRRLRAADGLQLQPRRHHPVSLAGERVRGAAGGP